MSIRFRQLFVLAALVITTGGVSGCGTINSSVAPAIVDAIPSWAGGLPADAPPRPGTAKYDEFMREREQKRLLPAVKEDPSGSSPTGPSTSSSSGLSALH